EYSLWTRDPERAVLPACRELGIGFVAFSPLGRGFFGSAIRDTSTLAANDVRRKLPRFETGNLERNLNLYAQLEAMAAAHRCTTAQLALVWILAKEPIVVPIPGTKRQRYIEENVAAEALTLTEEDMRALNDTFHLGVAAGMRYPEESMRLLET